MKKKSVSTMERFEEKYIPEPNSGCWLWLATTVKSRSYGEYGRFHVQENGERKNWLAHRFSWSLENGEIPKGMCVLHKCDNPLCVNPNHLFLGTQKDNVKDMDSKNRRVLNPKYGEENHFTRLSDENVLNIISASKKGEKGYLIARQYGISPAQVSRIINNKTRKNNGRG